MLHTPLMWIDKAETGGSPGDLGGEALVDLIVRRATPATSASAVPCTRGAMAAAPAGLFPAGLRLCALPRRGCVSGACRPAPVAQSAPQRWEETTHDRLHRRLEPHAFGKHDSETVESLIVRVTNEALAPVGHAGIGPHVDEIVNEIVLGHYNAGFTPQDLHASLVLQADDVVPVQAGDPGRERLRHGAPRGAPGHQDHRGQSAPGWCWWSASSR